MPPIGRHRYTSSLSGSHSFQRRCGILANRWILWILLLVGLLLFLFTCPVQFVLQGRLGKKTEGKVSLYLGSVRLYTRQGPARRRGKRPSKSTSRAHPPLLPILRRNLPRLRLQRLTLTGEIGLEDAALTALAVGTSYAFFGLASALLPRTVHRDAMRVNLRPLYGRFFLDLWLDCIIQIKLVHIMEELVRWIGWKWRARPRKRA